MLSKNILEKSPLIIRVFPKIYPRGPPNQWRARRFLEKRRKLGVNFSKNLQSFSPRLFGTHRFHHNCYVSVPQWYVCVKCLDAWLSILAMRDLGRRSYSFPWSRGTLLVLRLLFIGPKLNGSIYELRWDAPIGVLIYSRVSPGCFESVLDPFDPRRRRRSIYGVRMGSRAVWGHLSNPRWVWIGLGASHSLLIPKA